MSGFTYQGGDLDQVYMTTSTLFDSFVGERLYSWGFNNFGQVGNGNSTTQSSPIPVQGGFTTWAQIAHAGATAAAIKTDGTLWTWGISNQGQAGNGAVGTVNSPNSKSGGGTTWAKVAFGNQGTGGAIKTDGTLWMWGYGGNGQLGNGTSTSTSSPVTVAGGGTTWSQISIGAYTGAGIKTDGTLWTWGGINAAYGQLANGTTTTVTSSPNTTINGGTTWAQLSNGYNHILAIKTDGTLWSCGYNAKGQLGINSTTQTSSFQTVAGGGTTWKQVSAGNNLSAALKTDGTLWACGYGYNGGNGQGTTTNVNISSFQTISGGGTNWKQVSMSGQVGCATKTDGTLWVWGANNNGLLGNNTGIASGVPTQINTGSVNNTWKQVVIAGGGNTILAIG
jgi:alpha-tubulin suppressor-like RCC1 family protein